MPAMSAETVPSGSPVSPVHASAPLPKGRAKACTNCRQVKLKCNARETWPQPCFRCKSRGTDCRMDTAFRRVPARRQLEEVSQKLNNLQRILDSTQGARDAHHGTPMALESAPDPRPKTPEAANGLAAQLPLPELEHSVLGSAFYRPSGFRFLSLEDEDRNKTWTLGSVTISYDIAKALFMHFDQHKWHHIPVLQPCKKLNDLYASSDLLFWTIILQGARNHGLYHSYYTELLLQHRLLLGSSLLGSYSIEILHSILLICTWPYPSLRPTHEETIAKIPRNRDPAWPLIGAAINLATMMGLHRPGRQEEFGYEPKTPGRGTSKELNVRNVTWLYIFQLSTSQSCWLGVTPPLSSASHMDTIAALCKDESIPEWIRAKAEIQRRIAQYTIQLDTTMDLRTRCSLIGVFDRYIDQVRTNFSKIWCQDLEIDYQSAKLYLYGIAFINSPKSLGYKPAQDPGIMASLILQRGLAAAVQICHLACTMNLRPIPVPEAQNQVSSYAYQLAWFPKRFNLAVAFATIFLAWFLAVDKHSPQTDRQLARKHMDDVLRLFSSFYHSQEHLNMARKLESLTAAPITAPKVMVSSRLGASFMYSYNFMYRHLNAADRGAKRQQVDESSPPDYGHDASADSLLNTVEAGSGNGMENDAQIGNFISASTESWGMPWSEWDPMVFEELQNLTWDDSPWDLSGPLPP